MLHVSYYLRLSYTRSGESFEGNELILKESILFFQKIILEEKYQEKILIELDGKDVFRPLENLTDKQYNDFLGDIMEVGCILKEGTVAGLLDLEKQCPK